MAPERATMNEAAKIFRMGKIKLLTTNDKPNLANLPPKVNAA
jgi:hypothetical protein